MLQMFLENQTEEAFIEQVRCHAAHTGIAQRQSWLNRFFTQLKLLFCVVKPSHFDTTNTVTFTSIAPTHV
ncbi:hypothetical protein [Vibrio rarus]|uniref:hypothetical protein n=1 Tax=Vibrio rarus TaxID=413403 RepID=UPI0021C3A1C9|nr:hypothetical protein [Vibrio rarus]